ncbi:hypothetical protein WJX72_008019 [[Myrmecia] bisecta]|uniref:Uncharacterized protein n=1 Tax=[Myrmecia] bisecta TaxID=41462 RepID=A0AAW1PC26_9CHLO
MTLLQRLQRYILQHPLGSLEHVALVLLTIYVLKGPCSGGGGGRVPLRRTSGLVTTAGASQDVQHCPAEEAHCCCDSWQQPGETSIFNMSGVSEAPQPTMDVDSIPIGQVVDHHDARGDIYRFKLGPNIILNLMKTKAGTMRSGDLHNCTQFDVVLAGKAKLHTLDAETGDETIIMYGANDFIKIPARVPHLFEFVEENYMVEWWECDFQAWYYKPYRDRIDQAADHATLSRAAQALESIAGSNG